MFFTPLIRPVSGAGGRRTSAVMLTRTSRASGTAAMTADDFLTLVDICDEDETLAVNADPAVIGGAAFGSLNSQDTPSYDALVWRARADGNPAICAAGGLESPRLDACRTAAVDPNYVMSDAGVEVRIPLAVAEGSP